MKGRAGGPPRPKQIPDPALLYGQVVKEREGRRVVKVEKRLVLGRKHRGLKGETPAMRQGLTDHVWSVAEVLGYRSAAP